MKPIIPDSDAGDRAQVGAFFGLVAGVLALVLVLLWSLIAPIRPSRGDAALLHAGYFVLYIVAGAVVGLCWPIRRRTPGKWTLWFLATATGAVTVNSVAAGPIWTWGILEWRHYALMALLFTPVFAWDWPRRSRRS